MANFQESITNSQRVNDDEIARIVFDQMANFRERIAAIDERSRKNREAAKKALNRTLIKVGIMIISGYVIGTLIGSFLKYWLR